jgi:hypothetical protein
MALVDTIIVVVVIGGLVLAVWAGVTKQTIGDMLRDLFDLIREKREETTERYL